MPGKQEQQWYVLNVHSGKESFVAEEIKKMVDSLKIKSMISETFIPQQKKVVITKKGKTIKQERLYPGYILVKMAYNETTAPLLVNIEQVRGFVKAGDQVYPLTEAEVTSIMDVAKQDTQTYKINLKINDAVKIVEGTFKDFIGKVKEVNESKGEVTVLIAMFGRETPRVEKISHVVKL